MLFSDIAFSHFSDTGERVETEKCLLATNKAGTRTHAGLPWVRAEYQRSPEYTAQYRGHVTDACSSMQMQTI